MKDQEGLRLAGRADEVSSRDGHQSNPEHHTLSSNAVLLPTRSVPFACASNRPVFDIHDGAVTPFTHAMISPQSHRKRKRASGSVDDVDEVPATQKQHGAKSNLLAAHGATTEDCSASIPVARSNSEVAAVPDRLLLLKPAPLHTKDRPTTRTSGLTPSRTLFSIAFKNLQASASSCPTQRNAAISSDPPASTGTSLYLRLNPIPSPSLPVASGPSLLARLALPGPQTLDHPLDATSSSSTLSIPGPSLLARLSPLPTPTIDIPSCGRSLLERISAEGDRAWEDTDVGSNLEVDVDTDANANTDADLHMNVAGEPEEDVHVKAEVDETVYVKAEADETLYVKVEADDDEANMLNLVPDANAKVDADHDTEQNIPPLKKPRLADEDVVVKTEASEETVYVKSEVDSDEDVNLLEFDVKAEPVDVLVDSDTSQPKKKKRHRGGKRIPMAERRRRLYAKEEAAVMAALGLDLD